jgi:hypothetical protein
MNKETALEVAKTELKKLGFNKIRNNWYKVTEYFYISMNIQTSIYDSETYYVNFGATPVEFYEGKFIPTSACMILKRCGTNNLDINYCIDKFKECIETDLKSFGHFIHIAKENKSNWLITKKMKEFILEETSNKVA